LNANYRPQAEVEHRQLSGYPIAFRLDQLDVSTDTRFKAMFDTLCNLMTPAAPKKKRGIGFPANIEK
jgi:hypothetical protein